MHLLDLLGFLGDGPKANNGIDERLLKWAQADFRSVGGIVQLRNPLSKVISSAEFIDCWGVRRRLTGRYWEIVESPLVNANIQDVRDFSWPESEIEDNLLENWREEARHLAQDTPYAVIGEHPVYGILELGCWMCGYDYFLMQMAENPDFVKAFFDTYFNIQMKIVEQYYKAIGDYIDLTMSGDDFGMQQGPLISPIMFHELVSPYLLERIKRTKEIAKCYYWHHSCGSITALIEELITCGVDILNPIQTSAAGMKPEILKQYFGNRLIFWGAIDVQDFLNNATVEEVRREVKRIVKILGKDGGYVLAPAHNIQDDVPAGNIIAMIEATREMPQRALKNSTRRRASLPDKI